MLFVIALNCCARPVPRVFSAATQRNPIDRGELREMVSGRAELEYVLARLEMLLNDVWDERPADAAMSVTTPLVSLGVDSLTLALLFEKVGREFHIDWNA